MIYLRRVSGHSMEPTLKPNQLVIGVKTISLSMGQIVFARHEGREVIKRLRDNGGTLQLVGDNPGAQHTISGVSRSDIFARLVWPRVAIHELDKA